jgi:UDPglucose 6-dehydrogenase
MRVAVVGLWHLGCVTAACLSASGHDVIGVDTDEGTIAALRDGRAPLFEPGLDDLIAANLSTGRLAFSKDAAAVAGSEVVWITCDTPVDDDDRADVGSVVSRVVGLFPHLSDQTLVLISSQLPVGTTARFDELYAASGHAARVHFAYSPENLRLGKALNVFRQPDRVVVGLRHDADRARVSDLLAPITNRIEWMSIESAEMTKHALNAFLATSVAFANEIGALCEVTGADAKEVERGLKSESRIGSRAYLSPGAAFAGGTLARDLRFLAEQGATHHRPTLLLSAVRASNESHRHWAERRLLQELGDLRGQMIAVWGLTYKPGTDTLRRSSSVELCRALHGHGAMVRAHDPAVHVLPGDLAASIALAPTALDAVAGASALVVATEWPDYKLVNVDAVVRAMANPRVLDASRFLAASLGRDARVHYATVGAATSKMSSEVISGK